MKKKLILLLGLLLALRVLANPSQHLTWGGRDRTYHVHVPANLSGPAPLLVVLHGGGGHGTQIERHTRFSQLADEKGFLVIYPDGVDHSWNDGRAGEITTAHTQNLDDVGFIRAVVEQVAQQVPVDRGRIYVTGISNGGFMSFRLGAEAADLFCAIAPVAAGIPKAWAEQMNPSRPVSVLMIQGTQDPLVPYSAGFVQVGRKQRGEKISTDEAIQKWCKLDGCSPDLVTESLPDLVGTDDCRATRFAHRGGREGSEVTLLRVEGGGHTWPGHSQYLPKSLIGPVCKDFDASAEIWEFFAHHSR